MVVIDGMEGVITSAPLKDRDITVAQGNDDDSEGAASQLSDPDKNDSSHDDNSDSSPSTTSGGNSSSGRSSNGGPGFLSNSTEERHIAGAKCCFLFFLLCAAAALGTTVYFITSDEENQDFLAHFENSADEVVDSTNENLRKVFEALESLSLTTTTFILQEYEENNGTYPVGFVTLPDAEYHLGNARETSNAFFLGYAPTVEGKDFVLWETYSRNNIGWMKESWAVVTDELGEETTAPSLTSIINEAEGASLVHKKIWDLKAYDDEGNLIVFTADVCMDDWEKPASVEQVDEDPKNGPASPIWTVSPPPDPTKPSRINFNMQASPIFLAEVDLIEETRTPTFHDICSQTKWYDAQASVGTIETIIVTPVFASFEDDAEIVGHYFAVVPWYVYFENELADGTPPVFVSMQSSCGHSFTYEINGHNATLISDNEAIHNEEFDDVYVASTFGDFVDHECQYEMFVYPTTVYQEEYLTNNPKYYMAVVLAIFIATSLSFLVFDWLVQRRQKALVTTARKQNALVSSLFPKSIQKKLMEEMEEGEKEKAKMKWNKSGTAGLRSYLNDEAINDNDAKSQASGVTNDTGEQKKASKPIADLFPETTIMFADIAGFTAWSSTREPSQVFALLEGVYHEFDLIAKRRRVFKVEVVGDCYVAVCGLPDPRKDHAIVMAKFANDCVKKMHEVTQKLEVELGPDTTELKLRVGLHSGPVVAGVLRGDKSRFQLFGDTMNTTSRMESNGIPNRIHISQECANLLIEAGKEKWVVLREDKITAKGKGELTTYFLNMPDRSGDDKSFGSLSQSDDNLLDVAVVDVQAAEEKRNRIAEWTVEVLASALKTMVAGRQIHGDKPDPEDKLETLEQESLSHGRDGKTVIDEVAAYIKMPDRACKIEDDADLGEAVMEELRNYVQTIASLYNDNPFHNFDHANHVVMSVNKLLSRIIAPDLDVDNDGKKLHDHTYGITSDPLTWFACVFSALIHDVDHSGVPNAQLVKESAPVATLYNSKSVAEQNSFDIAWDLLMEPTYKDLRRAIYTTECEFKRFRQLVVNSVMATDIVDKDLKALRNNRWDAVFKDKDADSVAALSKSSNSSKNDHSKLLKATIVIEHLIQASDVAHTMQHWHIYRRWNERFFLECYQAYLDGRADSNPAKTWYKGEIGFFDFYIIPLAKKLKECGVFGVSSDEYLSYAQQNRQEWEERGEDMVREMVRNARRRDLAERRHALKKDV